MHGLTIGQVAKQVGISRDAIRIYEQQGLIEEPERAVNGYRLYSEIAIAQLCFILRAKAMGFSLKEIGELLEIKHTATNTCEQVRAEAHTKLIQVETKIIGLQHLKTALTTLIKTCNENKDDNHCPILKALDEQDLKGAKS